MIPKCQYHVSTLSEYLKIFSRVLAEDDIAKLQYQMSLYEHGICSLCDEPSVCKIISVTSK